MHSVRNATNIARWRTTSHWIVDVCNLTHRKGPSREAAAACKTVGDIPIDEADEVVLVT